MSITISSQTQQPVKAGPLPVRDNPGRLGTRLQQADISTSSTVTLGSAPADPPATYGDPRIKPASTAPTSASAPASAADLDQILADSESKTQQIMDLILPLVQQQGLNLAKVVSGEQRLTADPASIEKAKAAIADDGEFGVQQVADRILSFAKAAIGDDPSKLASFRAAVEDGFKQAADMLGGTLPEISEKTRSNIMATFDQWQTNGMSASADKGAAKA